MAIKAGRVGVAPDQVDEFGNINSEATSGYTKQEADAKFETQTHAASTYETKSDAAALQPKTLAVPISMLSGTKLTVETALNGLNGDKQNVLSLESATPETTLTTVTNIVEKYGRMVALSFNADGVTASAGGTLCTVPAAYRPPRTVRCAVVNISDETVIPIRVTDGGIVASEIALTSKNIRFYCTWLV